MSIKKCLSIGLLSLVVSASVWAADTNTTNTTAMPLHKPTSAATSATLMKQAKAMTKVNINTASAKDLAQLTRIGPKKAAAIVAYRQAHGPFKSIADLANVKGISKAILAENQARLTIG